MNHERASGWPLLLASLWLVGCGGPLGRAMDAFEQARYPDAVGDFRSAEIDFANWSAAKKARYSLYRGLTHLAVGDARQADRWLSYAKRSFDHHPELFTHAERGRLLSAWRSMGRMQGEPARI